MPKSTVRMYKWKFWERIHLPHTVEDRVSCCQQSLFETPVTYLLDQEITLANGEGTDHVITYHLGRIQQKSGILELVAYALEGFSTTTPAGNYFLQNRKLTVYNS